MYIATIPTESGLTLLLEWASGDLWLRQIVAADDRELTDSEGLTWSRGDYDYAALGRLRRAGRGGGKGGAAIARLRTERMA
jgi:hypothetical protein